MKMSFLLICVSVLYTGCKPDNQLDSNPPVITVTSPVEGTVFTAGQPIVMSGSVTDNNYISEFHIHVTNVNTNTLLMDVHKFPAANTMTFSESITAVAGYKYRIKFIALDKDINEGSASVNVTCN